MSQSQRHTLEEGDALLLDFKKLKAIGQSGYDVVPVVVQDAATKTVLILAYADEGALAETVRTGKAVFFSTSRGERWVKGATSGDTLNVEEIRVNCEQNSLLYLVRLEGRGTCHTKDASGQTRFTCYYRALRQGRLVFVSTGAADA
ncbi:MAG: phosphoribosyl-AMP cyclohydrolase [Spirochaetia bacterium]|nr:phosphoribosyl-AMP cyclohydrolase [Spirochaetia bacterium]